MVGNIFMELLLGIISGVLLSLFFSFGPAFFSLLQTSIHYGYRRAAPFAFGVFVADLFIVFLMLTVLKNVDMYGVLHDKWVASIAGIVIMAMGVYTLLKRPSRRQLSSGGEEVPTPPAEARHHVFIRGFVLNFVNPLIWIYWVSLIALMLGETGASSSEVYVFFVGLLGATLSMDLVKCKAASLFHCLITDRVLTIINWVVGVILIVFAFYVVFSMVLFHNDPDAQQLNNFIEGMHVGRGPVH